MSLDENIRLENMEMRIKYLERALRDLITGMNTAIERKNIDGTKKHDENGIKIEKWNPIIW